MAPVLVLRLKRASALLPGLATKTASSPGLAATSFALPRLVPAVAHPFEAGWLKHETNVSGSTPRRVRWVRCPGAVATTDLPSGVTATELTPLRLALLLLFPIPPHPLASPVTHPSYARRPSASRSSATSVFSPPATKTLAPSGLT